MTNLGFAAKAAVTAFATSRNTKTSTGLYAAIQQPAQQQVHVSEIPSVSFETLSSNNNILENDMKEWLSVSSSSSYSSSMTLSAAAAPSESQIKLLNEALGALYGEKNPAKAETLLGETIEAWSKQAEDELAALYRVRGDCYMELLQPEKATPDYAQAIDLLNTPVGLKNADPSELPSSYLGRARSIISTGKQRGELLSKAQATQASSDYENALKLLAPDDPSDYDDVEEQIDAGASRNPYACWEFGTALRAKGDFERAYMMHDLAADKFDLIGDRARLVVSQLDSGIDLVASGPKNAEAAQKVLEKAIAKTTSVEGRDVKLLQRVIAKEGEARIALASLLWENGNKLDAEKQLGEACVRLDQLEADAQERDAKKPSSSKEGSGNGMVSRVAKTGFSLDDSIPDAGQISCSRFKSDKFLTEIVGWPEELKVKVNKLQKLGK